MDEDNGGISRAPPTASHSNPLKKLKKKFNKLKHGGVGSRSLKSKYVEEEATVEADGSVPSITSLVSNDPSHTTIPTNSSIATNTNAATNTTSSASNNKYLLLHQDSFQSTGTASSLITRNMVEGNHSSIDLLDDTMSDSVHLSDTEPAVPEEDVREEEWMDTVSSNMPEAAAETPISISSNMKLELTIISGTDLLSRDRNGLSDPYVKVKLQDKTIYRTKVIEKTLTPTWDETFMLHIDSRNQSLAIKVFDRDKFSGDDFMGMALVDLSALQTGRPTDLMVELLPDSCDLEEEYEERGLGEIHMRYLLHDESSTVVCPPIQEPKVNTSFNLLNSISDSIESLMSNIVRSDYADSSSTNTSEWDYTVRIVIMHGQNLLSMDDNGFSDPYVRFKLQNEKYKTKVKNKTLDPKWMETFSLHLFDHKSWQLDISVFDHNIAGRDDFMGRASLDLSKLTIDRTHDLNVHLEDEAGSLRILVTITGAVSSTDHETSASTRDEIIRRYGLLNSLKNFNDVGWLQLKVIRAHGLSSKDWGGKSDPFCTVELVNTMLQSHTSYNTLNPEWNRVFTIPVKDIHSVLEVTVYDEDKDMKKEFIGKVAIPLIMIENGVQKWYGLKDKKLFSRVKGEVLLELDMVFNHVKAAFRTFNPREEPVLQEEPKFKISLFKRNVTRVRSIGSSLVSAKNFWQSLVDWDYPSKTLIAFVAFMVGVWNFELYMLPLTLIMLFIWNLMVREIKGTSAADDMVYFEADVEDDEIEEEDDDKESRRSFREYIDVVKSICCTIQEILGKIADLGEAIKNSVNWTIPWLSTLAIVALSIIMLILYLIPFRYIVLFWGVNKFTKKLRKPNYIPNNEVLDYLSRVPSDVEKMMYKEIRADPDRSRSSSPPIKGKKISRIK